MKLHIRQLQNSMGEAAKHRVIDQLNSSPAAPSSKRIARILGLLKQARLLNQGFQDFFPSAEDRENFFWDRRVTSLEHSRQPFFCTGMRINHFPEIQAHNERLNAALTDLYKAVSRYRWRYVVRHPGIFGVRNMLIVHEPIAHTEADAAEAFNVSWLLASRDHVERIRRCEDCEKWFYAVTEHQKFCADRCRKHYAAQSEEFKAKRASYMRERYRPTLKEWEQSSKRRTPQSKGRKA
jgi:hypothetical protein